MHGRDRMAVNRVNGEGGLLSRLCKNATNACTGKSHPQVRRTGTSKQIGQSVCWRLLMMR